MTSKTQASSQTHAITRHPLLPLDEAVCHGSYSGKCELRTMSFNRQERSLRHASLRYGAYLSWWSFYQVIFRALELKDVLVSPQETLTDESENVHPLKVKVWTSFVFQEAELNLKAIILFGASNATL